MDDICKFHLPQDDVVATKELFSLKSKGVLGKIEFRTSSSFHQRNVVFIPIKSQIPPEGKTSPKPSCVMARDQPRRDEMNCALCIIEESFDPVLHSEAMQAPTSNKWLREGKEFLCKEGDWRARHCSIRVQDHEEKIPNTKLNLLPCMRFGHCSALFGAWLSFDFHIRRRYCV